MSVSENEHSSQVAVLGIGNELLKDEGIGVHVIRCLEQAPNMGPVRLIDGGTSPDAINLIQGVERLIIVDAAYGGGEPGTVYKLNPEDIQADKSSTVHDVSVVNMLWTMEFLDCKPTVTIIGIEPMEIDWGLELSLELTERLPCIIQLVTEEIRQNLESAMLRAGSAR